MKDALSVSRRACISPRVPEKPSPRRLAHSLRPLAHPSQRSPRPCHHAHLSSPRGRPSARNLFASRSSAVFRRRAFRVIGRCFPASFILIQGSGQRSYYNFLTDMTPRHRGIRLCWLLVRRRRFRRAARLLEPLPHALVLLFALVLLVLKVLVLKLLVLKVRNLLVLLLLAALHVARVLVLLLVVLVVLVLVLLLLLLQLHVLCVMLLLLLFAMLLVPLILILPVQPCLLVRQASEMLSIFMCKLEPLEALIFVELDGLRRSRGRHAVRAHPKRTRTSHSRWHQSLHGIHGMPSTRCLCCRTCYMLLHHTLMAPWTLSPRPTSATFTRHTVHALMPHLAPC